MRSICLFFLFSPEVVLFGFDPIFDCLADERIGSGSFNILNAEISFVAFIFGWRMGFFGTLMADEVFLGDDGIVSHILEMFLVGGDKGTDPLWHFRCVSWHFSVDKCRIG